MYLKLIDIASTNYTTLKNKFGTLQRKSLIHRKLSSNPVRLPRCESMNCCELLSFFNNGNLNILESTQYAKSTLLRPKENCSFIGCR